MITHYSEFSGIGGIDHGAHFVGEGHGERFRSWVETTDAANHDIDACEQHALNHPNARHYRADVTKLDMTQMPRVDYFSASPACPAWTTANGVRRDFDRVNAEQIALPGMEDAHPNDPALRRRVEQYKRSRLLMQEIPRYLRAMIDRDPSKPVLIGLVENVIQCRLWAEWDRWLGEIQKLGYRTRLIAINAMHVRPVRAPWAAQSRDRLYLAYWHESIGRSPDWDKWLRPRAWCPNCAQTVDAAQVFKRAGVDMGRYGSQYAYRCPQTRCRGREVYPATQPALSAIDLADRGVRIGDRHGLGMPSLAGSTLARIEAGKLRHWAPLLDQPPAPFITPLRGGGSKLASRSVTEPAGTVTASGNHHGLAIHPAMLMRHNTGKGSDQGYLCTPVGEPARTVTTAGHQSLLTWDSALMVPYYGTADSAQPASVPVGTLTTHDRYGLAVAPGTVLTELPAVDDILFRMLSPAEIGRLMGFHESYRNEARTKKTRVRLYGNAVVAAVAELITSALTECLTGVDLPRETVTP